MPVVFLLVILTRVLIISPTERNKIQITSTQFSIQEKNLQQVIDSFAIDNDTILLKKGEYRLLPKTYIEQICGNCEKPWQTVNATVGLWVKGKRLTIIGESREEVVIYTNAGYGILFENSWGSRISTLTVTGGKRDPNGWATDAGIVAKHSRVTIENTIIRDNTNRIDTVVVGIGGIMGREGAELVITNNIIENNTWDGIALYRGSWALITDNIIKNGRGAGIGITWDASAIVIRNRISGYWKGIGAFGDSRVVVRNNAVYDNLGWGIIATGNSYMEVINNVIYHNGNCGFAVWEPTARGILKNNIIAKNGWKKEWVCPGVGVWLNADTSGFPVLYNDVWGNSAGNYDGVPDLTGVNGNISTDPKFVNDGSFKLSKESPCIDSGDPMLVDPDGTPSDMGIYGGPQGTWRSP